MSAESADENAAWMCGNRMHCWNIFISLLTGFIHDIKYLFFVFTNNARPYPVLRIRSTDSVFCVHYSSFFLLSESILTFSPSVEIKRNCTYTQQISRFISNSLSWFRVNAQKPIWRNGITTNMDLIFANAIQWKQWKLLAKARAHKIEQYLMWTKSSEINGDKTYIYICPYERHPIVLFCSHWMF